MVAIFVAPNFNAHAQGGNKGICNVNLEGQEFMIHVVDLGETLYSISKKYSSPMGEIWKYNPTTNQWTWVKGSKLADQNATYGTMGVAAIANNPGARFGASGWADAAGNLWLFGGLGFDGAANVGELSDVWKYNIASNQWTWMKGSNTNFQMAIYGTIGVAAVANNPGARFASVTWMDASGNFWLFGGTGYNNSNLSGFLNDLWKYNPVTNQWTWVKGSTLLDQNGTYGTMGVPASLNQPGGRVDSQAWIDASGNLWLFGGTGYDGISNFPDYLNDLWRYNPVSNQWAWIRGSNMIAPTGTYGTQGVANALNNPGGRQGSMGWADSNGNLWLFGGLGLDASGPFGDVLNDLWKYNTVTNQWTWAKGHNLTSQPGNYGILGIQAPANSIGARSLTKGWIDNINNLWLFGGTGIDDSNNLGQLNDLWKIENCAAPSLSVVSTSSLVCSGKTATLTALTISGFISYLWSTNQTSANITVSPALTSTYIVNGVNASGCTGNFTYVLTVGPSPTLAVASSTNMMCLGKSATMTASGANTYSWSTSQTGANLVVTPTLVAPYTVTCTGTATNGCTNSSAITVTVLALPNLTVISSKAEICKGEKAIFTVSGASSYSWHVTGTNTVSTLTVSPTTTTAYTVTGKENNGCVSLSAISLTVNACTGIIENPEFEFSLYPNPNKGAFHVAFEPGVSASDMRLILFNSLGQKVFEQDLDSINNAIKTELSEGIYFYQIVKLNTKVANGKVIME
mgnify:CR=1 FL=1